MQLTDRETQILVPNIVARSGHNILVIRESMQDLLRHRGICLINWQSKQLQLALK